MKINNRQDIKTLTKAILSNNIKNITGYSNKDSKIIVNVFFKIIKDSLEHCKTIKIVGFGNFKVCKRNVRYGRNMKTGDRIKILARKVISYKVSNKLYNLLNKNY